VRAAELRVRAREHVAVHVAAGRERVEAGPVDRLEGGPQVLLDEPVELPGLPRGELSVPFASSFAMRSIRSHWSGVLIPPGSRTRAMKL
jgi:hypothetical protein